jgi:hypothetical protein
MADQLQDEIRFEALRLIDACLLFNLPTQGQ